MLNVSTSNGSVIVSWPLSAIEFGLETTTNPAGGSWTAVTNSQSATAEHVQVSMPATEARAFFRHKGWEWRSVFQFAVFYDLDLEIANGPPMTVTGPVHCNQNVYAAPGDSLTFRGRVTAAGNILHERAPGDPSTSGNGVVRYLAGKRPGVERLRFPTGTNGARFLIDIPPPEEDPLSAGGRERFYNKADLIILVRDVGIMAYSRWRDNNATLLPTNQVNLFVTNNSFFDQREGETIRATQIDIARLRQWNATNTWLRPLLPLSDIRILYVADLRNQPVASQSGVRLVNGQTILPKGLTVATPNPLYVTGHYNCPNNVHLGTTNTSATLPAALVGDAITILSSVWNDANSVLSISSRTAVSTTVNAAFMAGIVATATNSYSGGLDNFPRLLENWSGKTFTYNGSMVVLWVSRVAVRRWPGTGTVYNPPIRQWAFDSGFNQLTNLPPGTPVVGVIPD